MAHVLTCLQKDDWNFRLVECDLENPSEVYSNINNILNYTNSRTILYNSTKYNIYYETFAPGEQKIALVALPGGFDLLSFKEVPYEIASFKNIVITRYDDAENEYTTDEEREHGLDICDIENLFNYITESDNILLKLKNENNALVRGYRIRPEICKKNGILRADLDEGIVLEDDCDDDD